MSDHHTKNMQELQAAVLKYLDYAQENGGTVRIVHRNGSIVICAEGIRGVTVEGEQAFMSFSVAHDALVIAEGSGGGAGYPPSLSD
mgnify:CR=1